MSLCRPRMRRVNFYIGIPGMKRTIFIKIFLKLFGPKSCYLYEGFLGCVESIFVQMTIPGGRVQLQRGFEFMHKNTQNFFKELLQNQSANKSVISVKTISDNVNLCLLKSQFSLGPKWGGGVNCLQKCTYRTKFLKILKTTCLEKL